MSLSDCPKCWDTPCTCGHEWGKYPLEHLVKLREILDKIITKKQDSKTENPNVWTCTVQVGDYDDDWSFRNKTSEEYISEGSVLYFVGETPAQALKAFTDLYSVEGFYQMFGDEVPEGYRHVTHVRSVMKEYITNVNNGIVEDLELFGNWDVRITLKGPSED